MALAQPQRLLAPDRRVADYVRVPRYRAIEIGMAGQALTDELRSGLWRAEQHVYAGSRERAARELTRLAARLLPYRSEFVSWTRDIEAACPNGISGPPHGDAA